MSELDAAQALTRSQLELITDVDVLSNSRTDLYVRIRDMKLDKIREFRKATKSGAVSDEICFGVTCVLMCDVAVCDILAATDFDDEKSVQNALKIIISVITASPKPEYQKEYLSVLSENDASLELFYSKAIAALQAKISKKRFDRGNPDVFQEKLLFYFIINYLS